MQLTNPQKPTCNIGLIKLLCQDNRLDARTPVCCLQRGNDLHINEVLLGTHELKTINPNPIQLKTHNEISTYENQLETLGWVALLAFMLIG